MGGDSTVIQKELKNVQQIQASAAGFAAILEDASVISWGLGGELKNVKQIQVSCGAL